MSKEWWKYHPQGSPNVQSQLLYKQNNKYWAANDKMLLGDQTHVGGPQDPFRVDHVLKPGDKKLPEKVTDVNHW
jgi:hypothetical protein